MSSSFRPILDRILVERIEAEAVVDGFQVPEKYRQHSNIGRIIALGDGVVLGKKWKPLTDFVQVGDLVLYGEYTAECWQDGDKTYWICRIQDVRGVKNA